LSQLTCQPLVAQLLCSGHPGGWRVHTRPTKIPYIVERLIDHQILGVHHVRDDLDGQLSWDIGFLIFGVLLIVGGWSLHKAGLRALERRALTTR
jgi:hypothetical protein